MKNTHLVPLEIVWKFVWEENQTYKKLVWRVSKIKPGELVILENSRFVKGELATIRKLRKHSLECLMFILTMLLQRLTEKK